ncbi:MAG: Chaperone protein dnaJ [Frankiales bacterium]|nr:Chaperone protein dnaJ [Frankiales bacterium]
MARPDYYAILGVAKGASPDEIKKAYRKLAREYHPDVNADPAAQDRFKDITRAYDVLSDARKKEMYDLGGDPHSPGGGGGTGPFGGGAGFGFGDIFDAFFGGQAGGAARGRRSRVREGNDALIPLELDLAETVYGVEREVTVETAVICETCHGGGTAGSAKPIRCDMCQGRGEVQSVQRTMLGQMMTSRPCPACGGVGEIIRDPCRSCGGDGRVRARRTLTIRVPAGVEHGMRIRLSGEGEVGPGGGPNGDLYVEIHERQHEIFTRSGVDLHCTASLPMTAAALGTVVVVPMLDGSEEKVEVKPGTQAGAVITLRGHGVPHLRTDGNGDLHVHVDVVTPMRLDPEQERLLRELARLRGEEETQVVGAPEKDGFFSRIRDAFGVR